MLACNRHEIDGRTLETVGAEAHQSHCMLYVGVCICNHRC